MKAARVRAASLAALLVACLSGNLTAQGSWTELRTGQFVLRGAFDAERLQPLACEVQQALRALGLPRDNAAMLSVTAAADAREARELVPQFWEGRGPRAVGAYWSGLFGHHVVIRVDVRREERSRRVLHELAHFATHRTHPNPPRWLDEGLAEIWEHAAIGDDRIEIGLPVPGHLRTLRSDRNWMPIAELVSAAQVPEGGGGRKASMFYAQSWALVHYLLFSKPTGRVVFDRLPEPDTLPTDQQLHAYIRGTLPRPAGIPAAALKASCREPVEIRVVPHVEALILKARAVADGERPDAAIHLLDEALRLEPGAGDALETLGVVHFLGNRSREAAAVFDRIIAEKRGSYIAYYYRALLAMPVPDKADGSGAVPVLDYIREAIRLNPEFAPARDALRELLRKMPIASSVDLCHSKLD